MSFDTTRGLYPHIQVSLPVQILSIVSTVCTLLIIIIAFYIIRKDNKQSNNPGSSVQIPSDFEELFLLIKNWDFEKYTTLLTSFLLTDEFKILYFLLASLREDKLSIIDDEEGMRVVGDGGWRNKNQISQETGLSSRKVYHKDGIVERLVELNLVETREAPSDWGRQSQQYRANHHHPLVRSMFGALLRS